MPRLKKHIDDFPSRWPFPRDDLYHWIPLLNRFDTILADFCTLYKLNEGPQTIDFGWELVEAGREEALSEQEKQELGFTEKEGDRQLIVAILDFSRLLLENCGNRSFYASSAHLDHLLNTTSLPLLESTLTLGKELAQRYQAALKRSSQPPRSVSNTLLVNHYNVNLKKLVRLAQPFSRTSHVSTDHSPFSPSIPSTPNAKGKERTGRDPASMSAPVETTVFAVDLVALATDASKGSSQAGETKDKDTNWQNWGDIHMTYYPQQVIESTSPRRPSVGAASTTPQTPTPVRRASNLGPNAPRTSRTSVSEESPGITRSSTIPSEDPRLSMKTIEIPSSRRKSLGTHKILSEQSPSLGDEGKYELLSRLRIADALTQSTASRRQLLAIRLLAICNLSYIYFELDFLEKVMKQDSEEPQPLQLPYQLAELIHSKTHEGDSIPLHIQTLAMNTLEALSQYGAKFSDVCKALQTPVSHGILLYVVRRAVGDLQHDEDGEVLTEADHWRAALFALLISIVQMPKTAGDLVAAGLIQILVVMLNSRTATAARCYPRALSFFDTLIYAARDAFQTFVSNDGLASIANLVIYTVENANSLSSEQQASQAKHRSQMNDYEICFYQQQTLKWLFKFIRHVMSTAGSFGTNTDRLLRNLIDSAPLLASLRQIIEQPRRFGSTIWTNAVGLLIDFINSEPTSYPIFAEAGLPQAVLESITGSKIETTRSKEIPSSNAADEDGDVSGSMDRTGASADSNADNGPDSSRQIMVDLSRKPSPSGIMPSTEALAIIPQAFSAFCLNNAGMEMFEASGALAKFFDIFESTEHAKCLYLNRDLPQNLGASFDELCRHQPNLRRPILSSVLTMIVRVKHLCKTKADEAGVGASLWTTNAEGKAVLSPASASVAVSEPRTTDNEVVMTDAAASSASETPDIKAAEIMTMHIHAVAGFLSQMFHNNSSLRADFSSRGGLEHVLDLGESPCLSVHFGDTSASRMMMQSLIATLADGKYHLVVPSLIKRIQRAADVLAPLAAYTGHGTFFEPFLCRNHKDKDLLAKGDQFPRAFVALISLLQYLRQCLISTPYDRQRSSSNSFDQINVSDLYISLVKTLGALFGHCVRESGKIVDYVPQPWRKLPASSGLIATGDLNFSPPAHELEGLRPASAKDADGEDIYDMSPDSAGRKNYEVLCFFVHKLPTVIRPFFQTLGKIILHKRCTDLYQRQTHSDIAGALAETIIEQLKMPLSHPSSRAAFSYYGQLILALQDMLLEGTVLIPASL